MTIDTLQGTATRGHAIITGGSSGIGLSVACLLAADGISVSILARDQGRLDAAKRQIEESCRNGASVYACHADVSNAAECSAAVDRCIGHFGPPDWAIASAGMVEPGTIEKICLEDHERQMSVNYFGSLNLARAVIPAMRRNERHSHLVFVASGAALFGIYGYSGYAPSKFAVRGLAEVLQVELFADGISVTIAYPPDTLTPQLAYEKPRRPRETRRIVETAGEWTADAVARVVVAQARKRCFVATIGWRLAFVNRWHSTFASLLRSYQQRVVTGARKHQE